MQDGSRAGRWLSVWHVELQTRPRRALLTSSDPTTCVLTWDTLALALTLTLILTLSHLMLHLFCILTSDGAPAAERRFVSASCGA